MHAVILGVFLAETMRGGVVGEGRGGEGARGPTGRDTDGRCRHLGFEGETRRLEGGGGVVEEAPPCARHEYLPPARPARPSPASYVFLFARTDRIDESGNALIFISFEIF